MSHDPDFASLQQQVRTLRWSVATLAALLLIVVASAFSSSDRAKFSELDVERINVRSADGRHAVIISNAERMAGNIMGGREWPAGRRGAGLLFYNADGNEAGGLIFDSERTDTSLFAYGGLSLDRFEGDQVAVLRYAEGAQGWEAGLQVSHMPRHGLIEWFASRDTIERLPTQQARDSAMRALRQRFWREGKWEIPRLFAGERGRTAVFEMRDMQGRERIRMVVDSVGGAGLEFLDTTGVVVSRMPD